MSAPKQHYVSRFYLRGFLDPIAESKRQNVLWLYERNRFESRKAVDDVGYERFLYDIPPHNDIPSEVSAPGFVEAKLHHLEDLAAPTLRKLSAGSIALNATERGEFAGFIALALCRTPSFTQLIEKVGADFHKARMAYLDEHPEKLRELMQQLEAESEQSLSPSFEEMRTFVRGVRSGEFRGRWEAHRAFVIKMMFLSMLDLMDTIAAMRWDLLEAPPKALFLTGDCPVIFGDRNLRGARPGQFTFSDDARFMFPVSRSFLLYGQLVHGPDRSIVVGDDDVWHFNRMLIGRAARQVYAAEGSKKIKELVDKIHAERPSMLPDIPEGFFMQALS